MRTGSIVYSLAGLCLVLLFLSSCGEKTQEKEEVEKTESTPQILEKDYERGPLEVHLSVSPEKPTILDRITFTISATIQNDYDLTMPDFGKGLSAFSIIDFQKEPSVTEDSKQTITQYYTLETFFSGDFTIEPLTFSFAKKEEKTTEKDSPAPPEEKKTEDAEDNEDPIYKLKTEAMTVTVHPPTDEKLIESQNPAPPYGPKELPAPASVLAWYIAGGAAGVILLGALLFAFIKKHGRRIITASPPPPHEIAYRKLRELIDADLPGKGQVKEFYFRLTFIVREYIENRFRLQAPEQTTEEFLPRAAASGLLKDRHQALLEAFLTYTDLIKYAKKQPTTEDIEKNFEAARRFINETRTDDSATGGARDTA